MRDPGVNGPLDAARAFRGAALGQAGRFALAQLVNDAFETPCGRPHVVDRQRIAEKTMVLVALAGDNVAHAPEHVAVGRAGHVKFVHEQQQHIGFAHRAETPRDLAQPSAEFTRGALIELQHRDELAQSPRRNPRAVDGALVPFFDTMQLPRKRLQAHPKQRRPTKPFFHHDSGRWKRIIIVGVCG
jgi:hypothetical protein